MFGAIAKLGGAILATLGIDYAVGAYKDSQAQAAQDEREQKIGKIIIMAAALFFGYKLLTKK